MKVFLIIILALFLVMVCFTLLDVSFAIIKSKLTSYIFKKYNIEEINNEKDAKIFIKKLFRFYAEESIVNHDKIYIISFITDDSIKYELMIMPGYPYYRAFKNNEEVVGSTNINHMINIILENREDINKKIKDDKGKALYKSQFINI